MSTPATRRLAGRYRLEDVLGRGGTGTVWAAYDEELRRRVAVKEVPLPPGMPADEADALRERTLREARAIAVLSHPNVVTLYDVVRERGEPFVVMELLPARSLAEVIREHGALDPPGAALVGHAVASALEAAHAAGITHRDVKPGNVLIGDDGRIKLTDFGIARNVSEATITVTGMTLGSPAFIAPEVGAGRTVTPAADLWGLGATLFAAVEGRPPYDSGTALATVAAVVNGDVPRPAAAGPLLPVIAGLMVKDPEARTPLAEVRRALAPLLPADERVVGGARSGDPRTTTVLPPGDGPTDRWALPGSAHGPAMSRPPGRAPQGPQGTAQGPQGTAQGTPWGARPPGRPPSHVTTSQPLAARPGPLPFTPPPRVRRSALAATALVLASAIVFVAATGGGFALSRWAAGEALVPVSDATRTSAPPTGGDPGAPGALTDQAVALPESSFTIGVPDGWVPYRPPLGGADDGRVVASFVSPDGNRVITVDRVVGLYPGGDIAAYLADAQEWLAASVARVVGPKSVDPVGAAGPGATEPPAEATINTIEVADSGAELARTRQLHLLPTATDLWVVTVTVPSDQQDAGATLFRDVVTSFVPG